MENYTHPFEQLAPSTLAAVGLRLIPKVKTQNQVPLQGRLMVIALIASRAHAAPRMKEIRLATREHALNSIIFQIFFSRELVTKDKYETKYYIGRLSWILLF